MGNIFSYMFGAINNHSNQINYILKNFKKQHGFNVDVCIFEVLQLIYFLVNEYEKAKMNEEIEELKIAQNELEKKVENEMS